MCVIDERFACGIDEELPARRHRVLDDDDGRQVAGRLVAVRAAEDQGGRAGLAGIQHVDVRVAARAADPGNHSDSLRTDVTPGPFRMTSSRSRGEVAGDDRRDQRRG